MRSTPQFTERLIQRAVPAIDAELLEQHRRQDCAGLNGQHHLHHIVPMALNDPVDHLGEQGIDMCVYVVARSTR